MPPDDFVSTMHAFQQVDVQGTLLYIPHPIEEYLTSRFGQSWKQPVAKDEWEASGRGKDADESEGVDTVFNECSEDGSSFMPSVAFFYMDRVACIVIMIQLGIFIQYHQRFVPEYNSRKPNKFLS